MNTNPAKRGSLRQQLVSKTGALLVGVLAVFSSMPVQSATSISQVPLYLGSEVPGNLALVPSVEFPTLISVANFGDYDVARTYVGYFDPGKCYTYVYSDNEPDRHFAPHSAATNRTCTAGSQLWSGNFMNWAATQTIDPFRSALTGGYRVRDTPTETWVEKAISDRNGSESTTANFPRRNLTAGVSAATPVVWGNSLRTRIDGLGSRMRFTSVANSAALALDTPALGQLVAYNPAVHVLNNDLLGLFTKSTIVWEVSIRVKVCDSTVGVEANCKQYSQGWKPEGLIQEYSERIRYSIFGYLNNGGGTEPEGGILRANQKFVGPLTYYPDDVPQANANREWDPVTGVLYQNPDPNDATNTNAGIVDSGVINYLNKFGQMNTGRTAKSYDNVSELYYTAVRYFKGQGNVAAFIPAGVNRALADGFPVIPGANWADPIRYQCQTNVILGIGDTNTWRDKNLPGPTSTAGEPAKPQEITDDTTVDVVEMMKKIWMMEGYTEAVAETMAAASDFNGASRQNSAYIAALAYDSHTRDIRPATSAVPLPGMQTISTHWVDVVENRDYKTRHTNQYWLAGKYGGFNVPGGFDPNTNVTALPQAWWWGSGDLVNGDANYRRPDNFYVAAEASKMVESLTRAFERIAASLVGSGGSFASNTTKLETGAKTYQARFYSDTWRGDLSAFDVNQTTGALTPSWNASGQFPAWATRRIYVNSGGYKALTYAGLSASHQSILGSQAVVDYLRGDRSNEAPSGIGLRMRQGILGDIVNSQPVYVGAPNGRLFYGAEFTGADTYGAYVAARASRTPVVYVGANDGMMHGFNANTGAETYAFMPSSAINANLRNYADPDYAHHYFVDGEITVADAYLGGAWKTVLVGTMGRGGRGIYALDVTDPNNVQFLWEKTATDIPALGNALGKPIIAQVANGQWRVFVGNGPNSTGDDAHLIRIELGTGVVSTVATGAASSNGLSGVNVWWSAGETNEFYDTVYAGDLQGNVWKVTGLAGTMAVSRLFTATDGTNAQPITAAPMVSRNPADGQTWVFVGTGRYLSSADIPDKNVQSWYGLIDDGTTISGRAQLIESEIEAETTIGDYGARVVSSIAVTGPRGWYMDLVSPVHGAQGERMVVPNLFQGLALIGTTRIPDSDDVCSPSGTGYIMAINPFTGGRLPQTFFDINGDGVFNNADMVNGLPVSGLGLPSGPNSPIFIGDIMQTSLDNAGSNSIKTNTTVLTPSRVSWREVVGN